MNNYNIKQDIILFDFLKETLSLSKNSIKNLLHNRYVYVNEKCITKYDYNLKKNDIVSIKSTNDLDIIYEDKNIIVVNKPYGLLTVSTPNEKEKTLYKTEVIPKPKVFFLITHPHLFPELSPNVTFFHIHLLRWVIYFKEC